MNQYMLAIIIAIIILYSLILITTIEVEIFIPIL